MTLMTQSIMTYWNNDTCVDCRKSIPLWSVHRALKHIIFTLLFFCPFVLAVRRMDDLTGCLLPVSLLYIYFLYVTYLITSVIAQRCDFPGDPSCLGFKICSLVTLQPRVSFHGNNQFHLRLKMKVTPWSLSACHVWMYGLLAVLDSSWDSFMHLCIHPFLRYTLSC